jgi:hypothetical protein
MTNIEAKEKAIKIVRKYNKYVRFDYQAIKCAIIQVESNIESTFSIKYWSNLGIFVADYLTSDYCNKILSELEKM